MKRFIVFAGSDYYPSGGAADFKGDFDTLEAAKYAITGLTNDWAHIFDTETKEVLWATPTINGFTFV